MSKDKEVWVVSVTKVEQYEELGREDVTTVVAVYDNSESAYEHYGDLCVSDDPTILGAECKRMTIKTTYDNKS